MLYKLCARCKQPTKQGNTHCQSCAAIVEAQNAPLQAKRAKHYDKHQRDKRSIIFYQSKAWRMLRERKLINAHNQCEICINRGSGEIPTAEHVHHIVPIAEDWSQRLVYDNLIAVCASCHRKVEGKSKREIDIIKAGGR